MLSGLGSGFNRCNFLSFCLKPLQVKSFEYLLKAAERQRYCGRSSRWVWQISVVSASAGFLACQGGNDIV